MSLDEQIDRCAGPDPPERHDRLATDEIVFVADEPHERRDRERARELAERVGDRGPHLTVPLPLEPCRKGRYGRRVADRSVHARADVEYATAP